MWFLSSNVFKKFIEVSFVWVGTLIREILHQIFTWFTRIFRTVLKVFFSIPLVARCYDKFEELLILSLKVGPIPSHVSFIMDGNRRYAKSQNLPLEKGHEAGGITLLTLVYICKRLGVKCVSCYAFSIENFNRPKEEVDTLMGLFSEKLQEFSEKANDYKDPLYGSSLKIVGDRSFLPGDISEKIEEVEVITDNGDDFLLYICLPYTSRNDIVHSMNLNINMCLQGSLTKSEIDKRNLSRNMYLGPYGDKCEMVIRTSGHKRLSDFMLWQCHENSTIEFSDSLWPDFTFLKMYAMMLRWSYYTNLQEFKHREFILREFCSSKLNRYQKHPQDISFDSLPPPPIAVTVCDGKK